MTRRRRLRRSLNNQRIGRGPIPRAAGEMLAGKGLAVSEHWTDVWREEHAVAFTVARMSQVTMVEEVHRELVRALQSGETMESFRARIQPWLERRGWAEEAARAPRGGDVPTRLERIYRTNMRTARAAGRWQRIERRADVMPYLMYMLGPSIEHRDQHVAWAGRILRVDDPWWNIGFPPNGWGCQCRTRQVTARERARLLESAPEKYSTVAPDSAPTVRWVNPARKDDVRYHPPGFDPGWDYNPGRHRTLGIHRHEAERHEAALAGHSLPGISAPVREEVVRTRIRRSLAAPGFRWFIGRPRPRLPPRREARDHFIEAAPVAVVGQPTRDALAAAIDAADIGDEARGAARTLLGTVDGGVLYLTEPVADKQWRRHGPGQARPRAVRTVPVSWWADIQSILDTVTPVLQANGRWRYDDVGRGRRLIVDIDPAGRLVVVSYQPRKVKAAPS